MIKSHQIADYHVMLESASSQRTWLYTSRELAIARVTAVLADRRFVDYDVLEDYTSPTHINAKGTTTFLIQKDLSV